MIRTLRFRHRAFRGSGRSSTHRDVTDGQQEGSDLLLVSIETIKLGLCEARVKGGQCEVEVVTNGELGT